MVPPWRARTNGPGPLRRVSSGWINSWFKGNRTERARTAWSGVTWIVSFQVQRPGDHDGRPAPCLPEELADHPDQPDPKSDTRWQGKGQPLPKAGGQLLGRQVTGSYLRMHAELPEEIPWCSTYCHDGKNHSLPDRSVGLPSLATRRPRWSSVPAL